MIEWLRGGSSNCGLQLHRELGEAQLIEADAFGSGFGEQSRMNGTRHPNQKSAVDIRHDLLEWRVVGASLKLVDDSRDFLVLRRLEEPRTFRRSGEELSELAADAKDGVVHLDPVGTVVEKLAGNCQKLLFFGQAHRLLL